MATVGQVEVAIRRLEGFDVNVRHPHGRNVRSDRQDLPRYDYKRRLNGDATVRQWIDGRFTPNYSGWDVEVLAANRNPVHGGTRLKTVRSTYDRN